MLYSEYLIKEFLQIEELPKFSFDNFGLSNSAVNNTLSFLDSENFLETVNNNLNITAIFVTPELSEKVHDRIIKIKSFDPRFDFYSIFNFVKRNEYKESLSVISDTAMVDTSSIIAKYNVVIEENTQIQAGAIILPNVIIKKNCIVGPGSIIGTEGFEVKRTNKGLISVFHDGNVILGERVEVGANCTIAKGIMGGSTTIGNGTKIDNLVHIAHNVKVGSNCLIIASSCILGSVTIGDDVWIGPSTVIRNGLIIGDRSEITMGSIISQNVKSDTKIVGRLAIDKLMTY